VEDCAASVETSSFKMTEFKDKIPAAGGKVEFLYDPISGGISTQISGSGFMAVYLVAVSENDLVPRCFFLNLM
jgi:hypothetical protein